MADNNPAEPFLTEGISLGVPNESATEITQIDNAIFVDSEGNINFKDYYTASLTDDDGNPLETIKLKDLVLRVKGVYVKDGKLYFKDSSVSRSYSLKEITDSYINWKQRLSTGGIYWIGSTRISNNECNNVIINIDGDPNLETNVPLIQGVSRVYIKNPVTNDYPVDATGTKVFSIDNYLNNLTDYDENVIPNGYAYTSEGAARWHNVPNLTLSLPPLDENKAVMIIAKVNIRLIKSSTPIVFRLIDTTTNIELDRKAVMNDGILPMEQQPVLTYFGKMPEYSSPTSKLDCACGEENEKTSLQNNPLRVLAVQFHTVEKLTEDDPVVYSSCENVSGVHYHGLERRILGLPNSTSDAPIVNMSIDSVIYDVSKEDSIGRKAGNATMVNKDIYEVTFETPFTGSDYTISLSCNKNINTWYTNKKASGFTIRSETKMNGTIDWIATKLKFEGDA
jgi:hypothetical protein